MASKIGEILKPVKLIRGGQKVAHFKNTAEAETVIMPPPERVTIPVSMHIGAPCEIIVQKGDEVKVGQLIADSKSPVSAPIHSSVSGTVEGVTVATLSNGATVPAVTILSDSLMTVSDTVATPSRATHEEFIGAVRASGLVGLGGAGFPASVKLNPVGKEIDTLVINAAECEPYITADYRECVECADSIMNGVYILRDMLKVKSIIICVEDNKPRAIKELAEIAAADDRVGDVVKLMKLPSYYPQGAEKVIVYSATGRKVPAGGLPADVGCVVMNITSVSFLGKYFKDGMPLITKRVTVAGSGIKNPQNVIVPIGTSVKDVIDFCGGRVEDETKILMGGPMMGIAMASDQTPVLKQTNAIIVMAGKDSKLPEATACIRCGRCVDACPMGLMPLNIEQAVAADDVERIKALAVMNCMECGCCSYGCPAKRPLIQSLRIAKQMVRGSK